MFFVEVIHGHGQPSSTIMGDSLTLSQILSGLPSLHQGLTVNWYRWIPENMAPGHLAVPSWIIPLEPIEIEPAS